MVNMSMGEHDAIQRSGVEPQVTVRRIGLHSFTLVHTAIQKDGMPRIGCDKVLTTGYFARSTDKLYFHGMFVFIL